MSIDYSNPVVRPASSIEELTEHWWPLITDLGWNRSINDATTHYQLAQNGTNWLLLFPKNGTKPEGSVAAFTYPNGTGWVAFFIMNEPARGHGLGRELWKGMEAAFNASGTTVVGLDGVGPMVKAYERRGYKDCATIHLMTRASLVEKPIQDTKALPIVSEARIVDLRTVDSKALRELDLQYTGLDRAALWTHEALFKRDDIYGYALVSSTSSSSTPLGCILVRRCEKGHRFGPLFAESYDQAVVLLQTAMEHVAQSEGSMIAEIFGSNPEGKRVFEELGWTWLGPESDFRRMWLGGRVPEAQQEGGKGMKGMFAIFDAAAG